MTIIMGGKMIHSARGIETRDFPFEIDFISGNPSLKKDYYIFSIFHTSRKPTLPQVWKD